MGFLRCSFGDLCHRHFLRGTVKVKNVGEIIFFGVFGGIFSWSSNCFSESWVFSKAELRFPILFVVPPLVHCSSSSIIFHPVSLLGGRHFYSELFSDFLAVIEYALPFREFYRRNDEYRIGGASRCFESFSNTVHAVLDRVLE